DVNPSIELCINKEFDLVGMRGINKDGEVVAAGMDQNGEPVNLVLNNVIMELINRKYINSSKRNYIGVSIYFPDKTVRENSYQRIEEAMDQALTGNRLSSTVYYFVVDKNVYDKSLGEKVSPTRWLLWQEAKKMTQYPELNDQITLKDPLLRMIAEKKASRTSRINLPEPEEKKTTPTLNKEHNGGITNHQPEENGKNLPGSTKSWTNKAKLRVNVPADTNSSSAEMAGQNNHSQEKEHSEITENPPDTPNNEGVDSDSNAGLNTNTYEQKQSGSSTSVERAENRLSGSGEDISTGSTTGNSSNQQTQSGGSQSVEGDGNGMANGSEDTSTENKSGTSSNANNDEAGTKTGDSHTGSSGSGANQTSGEPGGKINR
ncbi:MAG: hypothetical protein ABFD08_16230, partial [Syntrophomonas sp.]